jgi:hypothetical protein
MGQPQKWQAYISVMTATFGCLQKWHSDAMLQIQAAAQSDQVAQSLVHVAVAEPLEQKLHRKVSILPK